MVGQFSASIGRLHFYTFRHHDGISTKDSKTSNYKSSRKSYIYFMI